jgi:hypothetical protein
MEARDEISQVSLFDSSTFHGSRMRLDTPLTIGLGGKV